EVGVELRRIEHLNQDDVVPGGARAPESIGYRSFVEEIADQTQDSGPCRLRDEGANRLGQAGASECLDAFELLAHAGERRAPAAHGARANEGYVVARASGDTDLRASAAREREVGERGRQALRERELGRIAEAERCGGVDHEA